MSDDSTSGPPKHLYRGELGAEIIILSLSEIRIAQRLDREESIETADGLVTGRVGDFVVTARAERYPIPATIYYGTYEVLGRAGSRFVGRRLLHARRAWPVVSDHVEFDYGPGRGVVGAPKGAWIYQSDENDFGLINPSAREQAHVVVGTATELAEKNWDERFRRTTRWIALLPPVLALIALLAYSATLSDYPRLSQGLLAFEGILLLIGVLGVWRMRKGRWTLKSALVSGFKTAIEFQVAAQLLGEQASNLFPGMSLWRAAQCDECAALHLSLPLFRTLKDQIYKTYEDARSQVDRDHASESRATWISRISAAAILGCIVYAGWTHSALFELLAIWLPSVVGAVHSSVWRRQLAQRIATGKELLSELTFVRSQLLALVPDDHIEPSDSRGPEVLATVRMICRAVAEHTQRQLQFAISADPNLPV